MPPAPAIAPVVAAGAFACRPQPALAAGALRLRPWTPDDAPVLVRAFADPDIAFWNLEEPLTLARARELVAGFAARWAQERGAHWLVTETATGAVLGRVGLRCVSLAEGHAEAAYWTLPESRGRGAAHRGLAAVAGWALAEVGLGRVDLRHSARNPASCRVAGRAGFTYEGTHRHALRHADGWHDMHIHSLIAPDLDEWAFAGRRGGTSPRPSDQTRTGG
ncbi:acetyltransferase [Pilimelia terevasa]|uniref:Acetyltransferase n=1 Tax=Pilimelia terevasa TaxID=53372 RepID=A0A8J3BVR4_9ACTN|nr:GNAT family N-acetyltransferase [Pilimelia terevasa]GGK42474.1 acetyltransferase [Pilimelia terevasa]